MVTYTMTCGYLSTNFTLPTPIYPIINNFDNETLSQNVKESSVDETRFKFAPLVSPAVGCPIVNVEIA